MIPLVRLGRGIQDILISCRKMFLFGFFRTWSNILLWLLCARPPRASRMNGVGRKFYFAKKIIEKYRLENIFRPNKIFDRGVTSLRRARNVVRVVVVHDTTGTAVIRALRPRKLLRVEDRATETDRDFFGRKIFYNQYFSMKCFAKWKYHPTTLIRDACGDRAPSSRSDILL